MKKQYLIPRFLVVPITPQPLLAGSEPETKIPFSNSDDADPEEEVL